MEVSGVSALMTVLIAANLFVLCFVVILYFKCIRLHSAAKRQVTEVRRLLATMQATLHVMEEHQNVVWAPIVRPRENG